MPFEITWSRPGVLHYTFAGVVTGPELSDCIIKSEQFLAETLANPLYIWVEVDGIEKIPGGVFQALVRAGRVKNVPDGLIIVGATSYQMMVARLAAITFWGIDFKPIFVSNVEEGHRVLNSLRTARTQ